MVMVYNHYAYLWLYSAVCAPDDGCKQHPKHVQQIEWNREYTQIRVHFVGLSIENIHYQDVRNNEHKKITNKVPFVQTPELFILTLLHVSADRQPSGLPIILRETPQEQ
jgi:hypothetical protein